MSDDDLAFGLHWDRDYSVNIAKIARLIYLPIGTILTVLFVVLKKSSMSADYKFGYICNTVLEMCFDIYNCLFHQIYILVPYPIIMCTGLLCDLNSDPANLMVVLTFWTAAGSLPYMYLMFRMHQSALHYSTNRFTVSERAQALALIFVAGTLFFNVLAVHRWTIDIPGKWELLKRKDVAWAHNYTSNFLVLGGDIGDVGPYKKLTIVAGTMLFDSSLFNFLTFHAICNLRKNRNQLTPQTGQAQLRLIYSLAIQVIVCSPMFISPQILLFYGLTSGRDFCETWPTLAAVLRLFSQIFFSLAPLARSLIFLARDPWCRKMINGRRSSVTSLSLGHPILPSSHLELIAARNQQLIRKRASLP